MKVYLVALVIVVVAAAADAAGGTVTTTLCVGAKTGCYATIQEAVDAAQDGDTIVVRPGTYDGGITIDRSLRLKGAGAGATVVDGGGPVLTIGVAGADAEPTVSISGLTITGGLNTAPVLDGYVHGGGVWVPPSSGGLGATVTIADSVVTGNRAAPASVISGCGDHPFAGASGGGIDNDGTMTLDDVQVTDNAAGSEVTSDADGGGVMNERFASLTIRDSVVRGNVARVTAPNGRFAAGGGVFTRLGSTLAIEDSVVDANTVDYTTAVGSDDPCSGIGQAGGIKIGGDDSTKVTIRDSAITRNSVVASGSGVDVIAFAGGIDDDGTLTLSDSTVSENRVTATGASDVVVDGGAIEVEGPAAIARTLITQNRVSAAAQAGTASAHSGGLDAVADQGVVITDSVVSRNVARSTAYAGDATVEGSGILNGGTLELRRVSVRDNSGRASGPSGFAHGGGIWNGVVPDGPPVQLTLRDSSVTHNTLTASDGLDTHGGGLYTTEPVTLRNTPIKHNVPDDCFGCST
ncbi:MAG TPA: hypothetical protein VFA66_02460 [Gaiellaceae bacterium]|nr:hypothetical protein [Gaiellaceae bacterium]